MKGNQKRPGRKPPAQFIGGRRSRNRKVHRPARTNRRSTDGAMIDASWSGRRRQIKHQESTAPHTGKRVAYIRMEAGERLVERCDATALAPREFRQPSISDLPIPVRNWHGTSEYEKLRWRIWPHHRSPDARANLRSVSQAATADFSAACIMWTLAKRPLPPDTSRKDRAASRSASDEPARGGCDSEGRCRKNIAVEQPGHSRPERFDRCSNDQSLRDSSSSNDRTSSLVNGCASPREIGKPETGCVRSSTRAAKPPAAWRVRSNSPIALLMDVLRATACARAIA